MGSVNGDQATTPLEEAAAPAPPRLAPWPLKVLKFGGTSVGDTDRIEKVAGRIARSAEGDTRTVVVVSAMGRTTDQLIGLARSLTSRPSRRELDALLATGEQQAAALLTLALLSKGVGARSFTGAQAGFQTDSNHGAARVVRVDPKPLLAALEHVPVAVVAGFQGEDVNGNITTLGRGGSDTTAVALAAALGVRECEIYTDTDGIYSADPHRVEGARKLTAISYEEMLELASHGARVLHPRSVWYARRYGVEVHVRSSFSLGPGTLVGGHTIFQEEEMFTDKPVTGVALDEGHARVDLHQIPDRPGVAATLFRALGDAGVSVDMIIQGVRGAGDSRQQMAFIVDGELVGEALEVLKPVLEEWGARAEVDHGVAKLSIVGVAIGSAPGVAGQLFEAVAQVGANIDMITSSEVRISVLIPKEHAKAALKAVHAAFGLDRGAA